MTKNRNLKARIRARMARTGESYTAARAHEIGEGKKPIPLPTSRQRLAKSQAHGAKPGDYPWDRWYTRARAAGVDEDLAQLGRAVMREADQHAWCRELWERCGWTEESADGMIRFALDDPDTADEQWDRLMETDGFRGYLSTDDDRELSDADFDDDDYRELSDADFDDEYSAFARAFDPYFPADRPAKEESDPFIEIPGMSGILAPRSSIERVAREQATPPTSPQVLSVNDRVRVIGERASRGRTGVVRRVVEGTEYPPPRRHRVEFLVALDHDDELVWFEPHELEAEGSGGA